MSNSDVNPKPYSEHFNHKSLARPKRLSPFSIRLTEAEKADLKERAGNHSMSAYIHRQLFGDEAPRRRFRRQPTTDHQAISKALGELGQSRLAANMNQIAKAANMGLLPVTPELRKELQEACADIRTMRDALISALGIKVEW